MELQTEITKFFATLMNFERQSLQYNNNKCCLTRVTYSAKNADINKGPGGGEYSKKNWVGVSGPLLKTLTLFMTKICDIPYPFYDLTKTSKPYL